MKAIYIPTILNPDTDLVKLNEELAGTYQVLWSTPVNQMDNLTPGGFGGVIYY